MIEIVLAIINLKFKIRYINLYNWIARAKTTRGMKTKKKKKREGWF